MSLSTLIVGIVCMIVGYYLGTKETDKKWIEKVIVFKGEVEEVVYKDGTVENYRNGRKI